MVLPAAAALVFSIILGACSSVPLPSAQAEREYIAKQAVPLPIIEKRLSESPGGGEEDILHSALDRVYKDYIGKAKVIFFGERHACAGNFVILDRILPYFIDRFGVRTYVSEKGVAEGYLLDRYLESGNEEIIRNLMEMVSTSAAYTRDQFESFRRLRELWISLPEDKKFRYIGIDVGHGLSAPVLAFSEMIEDIGGSPPPPLDNIPLLQADFAAAGYPVWGGSRENEIRELLRSLDAAVETDNDVQTYLGDSLEVAGLITDSACSAYDFYDIAREEGYDAASPLREKAILDLFIRHQEAAPDPAAEVYFGQWGGFHIHRLHLGTDKTIAGMINAPDGLFSGQVLSTMIFYDGCKYRDRSSGQVRPILDDGGSYLGSLINADFSLIPFDLPGSPFREALYFVADDEDSGGVTSDYFQAGLLMKNAPAADPYR